jgi:hypothetical protein
VNLSKQKSKTKRCAARSPSTARGRKRGVGYKLGQTANFILYKIVRFYY